MNTCSKPLGRKAYGSIGHLPNSRLGPGDHSIHEGQAKICTTKCRPGDKIIVQEKLDGSCCAVAKINGEIIPLNRAGYKADTSPYEQHRLFHEWVMWERRRFAELLNEGERIVGEWLAQAHGTLYRMDDRSPFAPFDIMSGTRRLCYDEFADRVGSCFYTPFTLSYGEKAISIDEALAWHEKYHWPSNGTEGVVYRVERKGEVDFLAKYVRHDKVDGKYLPSVTGEAAVWNWHPIHAP